jgi:AbrB family looped-hinge helix DNA binding protein
MQLLRAKVTSKGQVTLPKRLRQSLNIHEGDQIEFSIDSSNLAHLTKLIQCGSSAGFLKHLALSEPVSIEAMDAAIRHSVSREFKVSESS